MFYIRTLWLNHITRNRKVSRKAVFFFFSASARRHILAFKQVSDTLSTMLRSKNWWTFGSLRLTRHIGGWAVIKIK